MELKAEQHSIAHKSSQVNIGKMSFPHLRLALFVFRRSMKCSIVKNAKKKMKQINKIISSSHPNKFGCFIMLFVFVSYTTYVIYYYLYMSNILILFL